jgi:hypothetical protein
LLLTATSGPVPLPPRSATKPQLGAPRKIGQGCKFRSFTTNTFKCNFLEVASGVKVSDRATLARLFRTRARGVLTDALLSCRCCYLPR